MKQKPSFQFYPQDFLSSTDVQLMTAEEIGCYCLLLFNMFVNGGSLPDDANALPMLCRGIVPSEKVMKKFYKKNGFLKNKRLEEDMRKQTKFSKTQSENALKRWEKAKSRPMPSQCHGINSASIRECSSTSTSSSTSNKEKIYKKEKFGKYVELKKTEYETLCNDWGKTEIDSIIDKMNDWIPNNRKYKDYASAIRTWLKKDGQTKKFKSTRKIPSLPTNIEEFNKMALS